MAESRSLLVIALSSTFALGYLYGRRPTARQHQDKTLKSDDESLSVLQSVLEMIAGHWGVSQTGTNDPNGTITTRYPIVNYKAPLDMVESLFVKGKLSLSSGQTSSTEEFVQMLHLIKDYSVNCSHKFFFNQLFGTLDPVALAADLLATACCHTSVATFETAPVFSVMEKDLMTEMRKIVFNGATVGDGLFCPGGSFSNLMALHVAKHLFMNNAKRAGSGSEDDQEEKKIEQEERQHQSRGVALVSAEAHYSFKKSASVAGVELISIPTTRNGEMDVEALKELLMNSEKIPFFLGLTAGSTVRGSFDPIDRAIEVCRAHQSFPIWVHVDGAWGGPAVFSSRDSMREVMAGVDQVDSFTMNPHKMLGAPQQTTIFLTRHEGVLKSANASGANYLFDDRKNGASFDLGDGALTCARKPDVLKFWAMYKFYGKEGLAAQVDGKVDALKAFADEVRASDAFMLACDPWPFNVNFYYLPLRLRKMMKERGIALNESDPQLPDDISAELSKVSVTLKLRMHEAGVMIIPYQPLRTQKADCFRLVLAGKKDFNQSDINHTMETMDKFGKDL